MKIYSAINSIMSEIGAIGKDRKNQTQGFAYRGIDDVMNALQPLLSKHKVFILPEVLNQLREERTNAKGTTLLYSICTVKYTFFADDGSNVSAIVIGEGMDSGDKATNKAMAIAMKYACFQVFCIPTEEMVDPERESHQVEQKPTETQLKALNNLAHKKGVNLAYTGKEWTGKASSKEWTMSDYTKVANKLEAMQDVAS